MGTVIDDIKDTLRQLKRDSRGLRKDIEHIARTPGEIKRDANKILEAVGVKESRSDQRKRERAERKAEKEQERDERRAEKEEKSERAEPSTRNSTPNEPIYLSEATVDQLNDSQMAQVTEQAIDILEGTVIEGFPVKGTPEFNTMINAMSDEDFLSVVQVKAAQQMSQKTATKEDDQIFKDAASAIITKIVHQSQDGRNPDTSSTPPLPELNLYYKGERVTTDFQASIPQPTPSRNAQAPDETSGFVKVSAAAEDILQEPKLAALVEAAAYENYEVWNKNNGKTARTDNDDYLALKSFVEAQGGDISKFHKTIEQTANAAVRDPELLKQIEQAHASVNLDKTTFIEADAEHVTEPQAPIISAQAEQAKSGQSIG